MLPFSEEPPKQADQQAEKADGEKDEVSTEKQDGEKVAEKTMEVEQIREVEQHPPSPMMMVCIINMWSEKKR